MLRGSEGHTVSSSPWDAPPLPAAEIAARARAARALLDPCRLCPRRCGARRSRGERGFCRSGALARVSSFGPHFGEEDCIRGTRGSGTVFFAWCNLGCVFCQNWEISHEGEGEEVDAPALAEILRHLARRGCHNWNLVTPTHVVPAILDALSLLAAEGVWLPIVYNSGGYDAVEALALLDGIVAVYMPDFKVNDPGTAAAWLGRADYPEAVRAALREMHRQVGPLAIDAGGIARRGVLVRHLAMPGLAEDRRSIFRFLAEEISPETYVNIMAQYRPAGDAARIDALRRRPGPEEMTEAYGMARASGLSRFDRRS
ncbi:MAG: radical SAM protein [Planctomycetes bacterium]|nr:radical SAM protein [Planctomycetota bacterium]